MSRKALSGISLKMLNKTQRLLVLCKTKTTIPDLYTDENKTNVSSSDMGRANIFADFFTSVFTEDLLDSLPDITVKDVPFYDNIK